SARVEEDDAGGGPEALLEERERFRGGAGRVGAAGDELECRTHEAEANDRLARTRGRAGTERIVGVGAGTDDRRIAETAAALAGDTAGGRGCGQAPRGVAGDGADRLATGREALPPSAARLLGDEGVRRTRREPVSPSKPLRGLPDEEYLAALVEHRSGQPDGIADTGHGAHRARLERVAGHEGRVHLDDPLDGQHGAEARVE